MKINFKSVTVLSSIGHQVLAANCDTNDLTKPEYFQAWSCSPLSQLGSVPPKTTCFLKCQPGFYAVGSPRDYHRCKKTGAWTNNHFSCQPDIETWKKAIEDRLDAFEKKIVDNTAAIGNNVDDIDDIEDDIVRNDENIAENYKRIDENGQNIQDCFRDPMNLNAIQHITGAHLEMPPGKKNPFGPLVVEINGFSGYAFFDILNITMTQSTANILCQKAGYAAAENSAWGIKLYNEFKNYPFIIGDMLCPDDAIDLSTCTSSGWGDLLPVKSYDDAMFLHCKH